VFAAILVCLATSAVLTAHAATNPFGDVPQGHWSYEAIAQFARLGLVEGYSADAFGGGRVVTRYEMAWAVARLCDRIKSGEASAGEALTGQQRDMLARLQEEFATELALVAGTGAYVPSGVMKNADDKDGTRASSIRAGGVAPISVVDLGVSAGPEAAGGAGNTDADAALVLDGEPKTSALSQTLLGVIPGTPRQIDTSQAWPSLRLRLDPGMNAALLAIPGEAGRQAFAGGKRLSELLGDSEAGAPSALEPVSQTPGAQEGGGQKQAVSIPLDEGAKAELSLGGPPVPGGIAPAEGDDVVARLDLKYALSQLAIFRASYELVKGDKGPDEDSETKARATTLLGIDYKFALSDSAFIKAGYTYSRITDLVPKGIEWSGSSPDDETRDSGLKAAGVFGDYTLPGLSLDARKTTASFGVGYTFSGTTSIVLGYRLIDFQDLDPETMSPGSHRTNVATAELTIRF
jgi:hypothetical protein